MNYDSLNQQEKELVDKVYQLGYNRAVDRLSVIEKKDGDQYDKEFALTRDFIVDMLRNDKPEFRL